MKTLVLEDYKRTKDLTIEEIKSFDEYRNLSDEQVLEVIKFLKKYCEIIYLHQTRLKDIENKEFNNNNIKIAA